MSIYMSRAELEEISEGLIKVYAQRFNNRVIQSIDIEHFITQFLYSAWSMTVTSMDMRIGEPSLPY